MKIKFGTDGWRAVISEDFTFENIRIVAQAIADHYKEGSTLAVGYDWRFLSEKYAEIVASVLAANGIKVFLSDKATPTPFVSLVIKNKKLSGGIAITASHNPPSYNGIKIKAHYASTADEGITRSVESFIGKNEIKTVPFEEAVNSKKIEIIDLKKDYMEFVRSYIDLDILKRSKANVLVDCMHGVGSGYIKEVLSDTPIKITQIRETRDPLFGGVAPEPIPKNLEETTRKMKDGKYDLCIVNDGDADRIAAITPDGKFIGAGKIMALLMLHFVEDKKWSGSIVKTLTNTSFIDNIAKKHGLKLHETPVGFKYICKIILEEDVLIGGEESGGISVKNYIPERDGILLGILLIEMMAYRKKDLLEIIKEAEKEYGVYCYKREDIEYPDDKKKRLMEFLKKSPPKDILGKPVVELKSYDGFKFILGDGSWLILRLSGTEPILRIYAEAFSDEEVLKYLDVGKKLALRL